MNARKLLLREKVEVRQLEEGLGGSWHPGVVVGVSDSCRKVEYDDLLCESGDSKLIESIPVTGAIEGLYQRPCAQFNYRGRIRPIPPLPQPCAADAKLTFGACVDVLFMESWWEGVISDCDEDAKERRVFFPDEGDERVFKLTDLRVTSEWDEFTGQWKERGVWKLVNLAKEHKEDGHLFRFVRRVWALLKVHYGFQKMISEWTCGAYSVWKEYFREVIFDMTTKPGGKGISFPTTTRKHAMKKRKRKSKRSQKGNAAVLTRSMQKTKENELSLAVRTRRMCLSEAEDSLIGDAAKNSSHQTDGLCMQSQLSTVESSVNTVVSEAGDSGEFCGLVSAGVLDEECLRMYQSDSVSFRNPRMPKSSLNMSQNIRSKRKRKLAEDKSTTRKVIPSQLCGNKLERPTGCRSKITRQVRDAAPLQFQDNYPVYNSRELLLLKQKKVGSSMRYPVHRKERRIRTVRRKKRSPKRIKKLYPRKSQEASVKSKSTLQKELEASKSRQKEGVLSSPCEGIQPVTASCQEHGPQETLDNPHKQKAKKGRYRDSVCLVCHYGGELLHCDLCMSSFHLTCVDIQEFPVGESFCPSCQCGLCGLDPSASDDQLFTQVCYQCSRQYHVACLNEAKTSYSDDSFLDKFCSRSCFEICARLHELLRISNPTSVEGLTWTITRSRRNDCNVYNERAHPLIQVSQVLNVFHECFEPILEPHTGRDLVADVVYNSGSKFRRLDFHGFYVIALVKGEELACVATIRIHGRKVAEMPLIATPFKYRRKGMCRLLVNELEKMLVEMGVERLVLPAIAQLSDTWVSSFGFAEMPTLLRRELLGYPFVLFTGTTLFQKIPGRSAPADSLPATRKLEKTGARLVKVLNPFEVGDQLNKIILSF
ncbi:hypothetical protein SOVF_072720 isoform B [Spinacia oleracea]|uniref:Uncharacterized protein isoform X2 n=1 Tax=Spinacia oleracea TaxID=3562 RepID=A0A9R0J5X9_SPIOL|nr:uncharacterized protein LOC110800998 isoform X2 [Spinacia oleracea]KNA18191.1 hypothetical protein SOVF_072720 isoform B [Spinacia oleracea]